MKTFFDCWVNVAQALFSQAVAGEPALVESVAKPAVEGAFAFAATLTGDIEGKFTVAIEGAILDGPLLGEGVEQKAGWNELLREAADSAAGEMLAAAGVKCRVARFEEVVAEGAASQAFELRAAERGWSILVWNEVHGPDTQAETTAAPPEKGAASAEKTMAATVSGIELLLDVELDASVRFGSREMPLAEVLNLGPGDVVELDRNVSDPVDLIVSDKIVARGEVVVVNGNFGLRVTEVAAPTRRLESIRCLF
jgi:flagellar motor switch protein FliN